MTKTEAAEILANEITVTARRESRTTGRHVQIDKDYIEDIVSERYEHGTGQIREAARLLPSWKSIRSAGRRNQL